MRTWMTTIVSVIAGAVLVAGQQAPAPVGYDDTPMQPNGRWRIHDCNRPQPKVVTPVALTPAPPPQDATVLIESCAHRSPWLLLDGVRAVTWPMSNGVLETGRAHPHEGRVHRLSAARRVRDPEGREG